MEHEDLIIKIVGQEAAELYEDLISLEVELDDELVSMFKLKIALVQQPDGTWSFLDDERLLIWKEVKIDVGFGGSVETLLEGYITHTRPYFDPDPAKCTLEIWGMDRSIVMDREEKVKDWPNKKDSDIVSEILNSYGFTPQVDDTSQVHDETISTIIQRETDLQFLNRLALRNGFQCYVEGTTGYFVRPDLDGPTQPVLAVCFGTETNVNRFNIQVDALKSTHVSMVQMERLTKNVLEVAIDSSLLQPLGDADANSLLAAGINPASIYVGMNAATGIPEMTALCQGLYHESDWFITGAGEIGGTLYGHVLKPRGTVTIKGVGENYSGVYYVNHVTHTFNSLGYTQFFQVKRNALWPTGSEDFSSAAPQSGMV